MTRVGIDIGGTFTDLVCISDGRLVTAKVPSTPGDFSRGFLDALREAGLAFDDIDRIVHATTVATNALIERKGARCGLITTEGFRDVLDLRRRNRRRPYGIERPFEPLIAREHREEVAERASAEGIERPVDGDAVRASASRLVSAGVEAIVVGFLHSASHPENERAAVAVVADVTDLPAIASSAVCDEPTEFERFSTAAASAYVTPLIRDYIAGIERGLASAGAPEKLWIVTSDGGLVDGTTAGHVAVRTALSGPAAGVWGARRLCQALDVPDFVACDMGGTSFDACLVTGDVPVLTEQRELDFGLPIALPMLDIATIGAGGGSVVNVGPLADLEIGPEGLGADPGPACYGKQAHQAAVSDASVVLGRLGDRLLLPSGARDLDVGASRTTLAERVAGPMGADVEDAAAAIIAAVDAKMADRIRDLALERRVALDALVLVAYGGAGPMHAAGIARELGIGRVLIPPRAGAFSAWGGLLAQARDHTVARVDIALDAEGLAEVRSIAAEHVAALGGARAEAGDTVLVELDAAYAGQTHGMVLPVTAVDAVSTADLRDAFTARYAAAATPRHLPIRIRRVITTVERGTPPALASLLPRAEPPSVHASAEPARRDVRFGEAAASCPVYVRSALPEDGAVEGPCIVEEPGATTIVPPGATCRVGSHGVLWIEGLEPEGPSAAR